MLDNDQRPKVTVEDLLRLKRAERPDVAFWNSFERELRQKQLSALLEKRPWWQQLPRFITRRAYLPVGATAILAFTLVSVKYYTPGHLVRTAAPVAGQPAVADLEVVPSSAPSVTHAVPMALPETMLVEATTPAASATTGEPIELMPLLVVPREAEKPSTRLLAANLSHLEQPESDFSPAALSNRLSAPARVQTVASAEDELASVPINGSRRHRLLASYDGRQLNPEPLPPAVVPRRLGDPETSDRDTRMAREMDSFGTPMPQIVALRF